MTDVDRRLNKKMQHSTNIKIRKMRMITVNTVEQEIKRNRHADKQLKNSNITWPLNLNPTQRHFTNMCKAKQKQSVESPNLR